MTDREILQAIRRHCEEVDAERATLPAFLTAYQARRLLGFCERTIKCIQEELRMMKCDRCESRPVDGSGIMCGECCKDTCDEQ